MLKLIFNLKNGPRYSAISSHWWTNIHQFSTTVTIQKVDKSKETINKKNLKIHEESKNPMVNRVFKSLNNNNNDDDDTMNDGGGTSSNKKKSLQSEKTFDTTTTPSPLPVTAAATTTTTTTTVKEKKNVKKTSDKFGVDSSLSDLNESFANVQGISMSETVQLMSSLAMRQRRVKPLLKTLADNIINSENDIGIKNIADILYSMAKLNFRNELLLVKLCDNLQKVISSVEQSPIIGSILTSLGMLRYRNDQLMDEFCKWGIKNRKIIRTQDLCAMVLTLATIGYVPIDSDELFKDLLGNLKETDMTKSSEWLDIVWSLTVLNRATSQQISSVLDEQFHQKLADLEDHIPLAKKQKLLNINSYAKYLFDNYKGPFIKSNSNVFDAPLARTKDKQIFVKSITDALANLFPSRDHFRLNVDGGIGFLTDVEFFMDKKGSPLPIDKVNNDTKALRIAILANYYHDYCLGKNSLVGSVLLHQRLLEANGYRIIDISHFDLRTDDNLLKRITYINDRLKTIVK